MIADLIPHDPPRRDLNASYPLRSRFWITSVVAHILWVSVIIRIPLSVPESRRPIYDQFIRPLESRVLVYRPARKTVTATPEKRVGDTPNPRGKLVAPRTVIANAPNAQSQKQIIWKPINLPEIQMDVPAPTVVARVEALPPPPPRLVPKQFTPPPAAKTDPKLSKTEVNATLASAPAVTVTPNAANAPKGLLPPPPKVAPKKFVPPPASRNEPKLAIKTEVNETMAAAVPLAVTQNGVVPPSNLAPPPKVAPKQFKAPAVSKGQQQAAKTEVNETVAADASLAVTLNGVAPPSNLPPPPKVAPKQFKAPQVATKGPQQAAKTEVNASVAAAPQVNSGVNSATLPSMALSRLPSPPKDLPPAPVPTRGNEQANIAIASVNPAPSAEVPASSRAGQFSVAPEAGEPSSGIAPPGALTVPNLAVREPAAPPKPPAAKSNTLIYAEKVRAATSATFTVPLRPVNRAVPKAIDARFPGRTMYAVVIPIENLPAYGTDWILWFAESAPQPGAPPSVRAPVPTRKLELIEKSREPNDTRLQIAATLTADGRLSNLKVLSAVSGAIQSLAIEDLSSWEWKPATRNNIPISIEAVFEIPFRLAVRP